MGKKALVVDNVSMKFNLNSEGVTDFKEFVIKLMKKELHYDEFWALKNVSFSVEQGDRVGILGLNGSGKSTLLKTIAGVYKPTEGNITKNGKVVPMLELGAGFDPQYTGRENIFLYGAVLGYSKKFLQSKFKEIVKFSELEKFIDVPIKNYSSGMKSKLGFSIATIANPEILILDEVLSVGDARFKRKSEKKMMSLIEGGTTVLFVSHSLAQVQRICNKAIILDHGEMVAYGDMEEIAEKYQDIIDADHSVLERKMRRLKKLQKRQARIEKYLAEAEAKGMDVDFQALEEKDAAAAKAEDEEFEKEINANNNTSEGE